MEGLIVGIVIKVALRRDAAQHFNGVAHLDEVHIAGAVIPRYAQQLRQGAVIPQLAQVAGKKRPAGRVLTE